MFRDFTLAVNKHYLPEPKVLKAIRDSCPHNLKKMQMSYDECRILSLCLKMIKAEKVLELGTLVGCSTAWIANALTGAQPIVVSVEKSTHHYKLAQANINRAGLQKLVRIINSDAISVLESYVGQELFDAIIIDAKKIEYSNYLKLAKLSLRSGGLIIADNTLMIDDALGEISAEITKFNHIVENDPDLVSIILPTTAGMTVILKQ
jgi:predicted O-methyltransferase YrrM